MNRISNALQFIPAHDRDTWVTMAMAVKSELGDAGFDVWDDWSQTASNYSAKAARSVWKSCKGTGITAATLFHEAKQYGWRDEGFQRPTAAQIDAKKREAEERLTREGIERAAAAKKAAEKADWILKQCTTEKHAYLFTKGFPDLEGLVWRPVQEQNLLCIPMYVGKSLAGVQLIDKEGTKKYLSGQITAKAEFCFDSGGAGADDWWIEGYASALSLRACLQALKRRYRIHVTFSAQNLKRMAHGGYVIADHDASRTGESAAIATGLPYWLPPTMGQDINDVHVKNGMFKTSQMLGKWLREVKENAEFYGD